jgi:hypothetical protein
VWIVLLQFALLPFLNGPRRFAHIVHRVTELAKYAIVYATGFDLLLDFDKLSTGPFGFDCPNEYLRLLWLKVSNTNALLEISRDVYLATRACVKFRSVQPQTSTRHYKS